MEPIKVNVSVELNLSEDVKQFVTSLISCNTPVPTVAAPKPAVATPKPAASTAKPAVASREEAPEPTSAKPATGTQEISIEDVRKALASKVANHRVEIKEKLDELGAPSVTKLDPAKYPVMYKFLIALD